MADLTCKWEHHYFFYRNFSSQRICASNSTALDKEISCKKLVIWGLCANKYAKNKEENNMTILAIYHRALVVIMGDCYRMMKYKRMIYKVR